MSAAGENYLKRSLLLHMRVNYGRSAVGLGSFFDGWINNTSIYIANYLLKRLLFQLGLNRLT